MEFGGNTKGVICCTGLLLHVHICTHTNSRDSVVSIMYDSDFEYKQGQEIFLFFSKSLRPAVRPTQPPIQWDLWLIPGG